MHYLLPWFIQYQYWIIFPVAVVEGPIITILTGFVSSLGYINLFIAYPLIVGADLLGDSIYYWIGKYGREKFIIKYGKYVGLTTKRVIALEKYFEKHSIKTFWIAKFSHGIGAVVLTAGGLAKVPYKKMILANIPSTALKSLILILLGFYFGKAYLKFNSYLIFFGIALPLFIVAVYIILYKIKFFQKFNTDV